MTEQVAQLRVGIWGKNSFVVQLVKNLPTIQETWVDPWVRKIPLRRKWQPNPVFLPGKSYGQRSLVGYSLWVARVGVL